MNRDKKIRVIETRISSRCVEVHGSVEGAVDEALKRVREKAIDILKTQPGRLYSIECNRVLIGAIE